LCDLGEDEEGYVFGGDIELRHVLHHAVHLDEIGLFGVYDGMSVLP